MSASCTRCWPVPVASTPPCWSWRCPRASAADTRASADPVTAGHRSRRRRADQGRPRRRPRRSRRARRCSTLLAETRAACRADAAGVRADRGGDRRRCGRRWTPRPARRVTPSGHPRLAVDRAFTLTGAGLVVTGTLVSGRIAVEDRLMLSPSGLELRVRGLHAQNRPARVRDSGPARGAEHHRPAAVEGRGRPAATGCCIRTCMRRPTASTSACACWRRSRARCARIRRCICISAPRM